MPESVKNILVLSLICFVTASLLTGVYLLTRPKILEQKTKAQDAALKEVMPEAGYFERVVRDERLSYFKAYLSPKKKRLLGYAFFTQAKGYASIIETVAGMNPQGKITGIKILTQQETPGLGAKIEEVLVEKTLWQAIREQFLPPKEAPPLPEQPWFCAQFKGKGLEDLCVVTTPTQKKIQAITGATISSRALTDSVRAKAKEILQYER